MDFEESEEQEIKFPAFVELWRKQGSSTSASLITLKPLTAWITTNCKKFLEGVEKREPSYTVGGNAN